MLNSDWLTGRRARRRRDRSPEKEADKELLQLERDYCLEDAGSGVGDADESKIAKQRSKREVLRPSERTVGSSQRITIKMSKWTLVTRGMEVKKHVLIVCKTSTYLYQQMIHERM